MQILLESKGEEEIAETISIVFMQSIIYEISLINDSKDMASSSLTLSSGSVSHLKSPLKGTDRSRWHLVVWRRRSD